MYFCGNLELAIYFRVHYFRKRYFLFEFFKTKVPNEI